MLHMHELARVIVADREREIRERLVPSGGVPSGPRHPAAPEHASGPPSDAEHAAARLAVRRVAFSR